MSNGSSTETQAGQQPAGGAAGTSCGPDVTDWFVNIMNNAKTDRLVLAIKGRLGGAARTGSRFGYSSMDVVEGGLVRKVLAAAQAVGNPQRTVAASAQISSADPQDQFGRAVLGATVPIVGFPEQLMLAAIRGASLTWKSLVETNAVFDFKNTVLARARLSAAGCPPMCPGDPTVTIGGICFENDLPGNLFYAYIGRFVGYSLNSLQLGSQFAELQPNSSSNWDSPEDTAAITLGFGLPQGTLSRSALMSALHSPSAGVRVRQCAPCPVVFNPTVPLNP